MIRGFDLSNPALPGLKPKSVVLVVRAQRGQALISVVGVVLFKIAEGL